MPWVRTIRRIPIPNTYRDPRIIPEYREEIEERWQDPDGTLITRSEYEARSMPRSTPWYDRRASARDPNRELTAAAIEAERRAERERWQRYEDERRREFSLRGRSPWSIVDETSTLQYERNADVTSTLHQWYRDHMIAVSNSTIGRMTIDMETAPSYDQRISGFFGSRPLLPMPSAYNPADLDEPLRVRPHNTFASGAYGFLDDDNTVHYFCDKGAIPCAHLVRVLVRYYGTRDKARALCAPGQQVAYVTPSAVIREEGGSISSLDWSRWDGGTPCPYPGRTNYVVFIKDAWHIRAKKPDGVLYWERLEPDTL